MIVHRPASRRRWPHVRLASVVVGPIGNGRAVDLVVVQGSVLKGLATASFL